MNNNNRFSLLYVAAVSEKPPSYWSKQTNNKLVLEKRIILDLIFSTASENLHNGPV